MGTKNGITTTYYLFSPATPPYNVSDAEYKFMSSFLYPANTLMVINEYADGTPLMLHIVESTGEEKTIHPDNVTADEILNAWGHLYNINTITKEEYDEKAAIYIL